MKKTKYLRKNDRGRFSNEYSLRGKLYPESVTHLVRTNSGITLVALVVTIIILLILAGVTLALVSGGNGILNKAEVAVNKTKEAAAREKLEMELISVKADVLSKGEKVSLSNLDERKEELAENGVFIAESGTPRDVSFDGYTFKVKDDLTIEGDGIGTGGNQSGGSSSGGTQLPSNISDKKDLWANWLTLAEIDVSDLNSNQILSNQTIMNQVMNHEEAINYMIESKTFIVPAVSNSQVAMAELGKSNYLQNILRDLEVITVFRDSPYANEIVSNLDKSEKMSSNENENAKTFASSSESNTYQAWKAFDGTWNWQNSWISLTIPDSLTYQYKNKSVVPYQFIVMGNSTSENGAVGQAYIETSKDGEDWKQIVDTFDLPINTKATVYPNQNLDDYSFFRLVVTKATGTYGRNKAIISEMEIYGK